METLKEGTIITDLHSKKIYTVYEIYKYFYICTCGNFILKDEVRLENNKFVKNQV